MSGLILVDPAIYAPPASPGAVTFATAAGDGSTGAKATLTLPMPSGTGGQLWAALFTGHSSGYRRLEPDDTDWTQVVARHGTDMPGSADQDLQWFRYDGAGTPTSSGWTVAASASGYVAGISVRVPDGYATAPNVTGQTDSDVVGGANSFLEYCRAPVVTTTATDCLALFAGTWYNTAGASTASSAEPSGWSPIQRAQMIITNGELGDDSGGIFVTTREFASAGSIGVHEVDWDGGAGTTTRQWLSAIVCLEPSP